MYISLTCEWETEAGGTARILFALDWKEPMGRVHRGPRVICEAAIDWEQRSMRRGGSKENTFSDAQH